MQLKQVLEWLITNGLVQNQQGKFKFTNKFYKQLTEEHHPVSETGLMVVSTQQELAIPDVTNYHTYRYEDWVNLYQGFIMQCKIPAKMESSNGNVYSGNKYSEDGMKAFQKAIRDGYRYDVLRVAISLYYASGIRWKKAIGSYMTSGEWRSDYASLLSEASKGEQSLNQHIKRSIDDRTGAGTHYELG